MLKKKNAIQWLDFKNMYSCNFFLAITKFGAKLCPYLNWQNFYRLLSDSTTNITFLSIKLLITIFLLDSGFLCVCVALDLFKLYSF